MAGSEIKIDPQGRPWRVMGTPMPPQLLMMCKLVFLLLLVNKFPSKIGDPFLPFLPGLDSLRAWPGLFETTLLIAFFVAGALLSFNIAVRPAAIVLGLVVLLTVLASKPIFRNHLFITGCLFLLSGLHKKDDKPWMLYLQFSVIYFGASLNKAFDPDWQTGQFMHHWLLHRRGNPTYMLLAPLLPPYTLAVFLSWAAILTEAASAVLFAIFRTRVLAVWLTLLFHWTLFVLLRGTTFGHFLEDILIALILFLSWPRHEIVAIVGDNAAGRFVQQIRMLDWDQRVQFEPAPVSAKDSKSWLEIRIPGKADPQSNREALQYLLRYSTGWYVLLFVGYHLAKHYLPDPYSFAAICIAGTALMLLFLPVSLWKRLGLS